MTKSRTFVLIAALCLFVPIILPAQTASPTAPATNGAGPDRLAKLEQQIADAKSSADNAWMLTSSALVLLMTGPGLALFYGGLVRKKNVLATMMQSFAMMAIVTVTWAIFGYALAFGEGNSIIGGLHNLFLRGVGAAPDPAYAATIPAQTFMVYQLMFAIITPALITGAFAERHEIQRHGRVHGLAVNLGLQPNGAHGVGQERIAECIPRRTLSYIGFCRRYGCPHHFRRFRPGMRFVSRTQNRIPEAEYASTQRGAQLYRRLSAVGRLVWIQRRQRFGRRQSGHERICRHTLCRGHGGPRLGCGGGLQHRNRAHRY
jgi:hypothetical protein